jgi:GNAT superfamily N-acetyltransferase
MDLTFRHFDYESNLTEQRLLFRNSFPEGIGTPAETPEYYDWKFHGFPAEIKSYEYAAWANETSTLVGYYAAIPYRYRIDGQILACGMVCDVMTHSSARGKGVFTRLGRYATDELRDSGILFTTGYPVRPEVIPGHLKVGWKVGFPLPLYIRILKANALLEGKKLKLLTPIANAALRAFNSCMSKAFARSESYSATVRDTKGLVDLLEYDQFFADWSKGQKHILVKDRDFWKWRLGAPGTEYKIICIYEATKLIAMVVTRRTDLKSIPTLAILDLMVVPGRERSLTFLHLQTELLAHQLKAEAISVMVSKTWAGQYRLLRHGFLKSPFVFKLIFKRLSEIVSEESLAWEANWHLMWVDCDDL